MINVQISLPEKNAGGQLHCATNFGKHYWKTEIREHMENGYCPQACCSG